MNLFQQLNEAISGQSINLLDESVDAGQRSITQSFNEMLSETNMIISEMASETYAYNESAVVLSISNESAAGVQLEALNKGFIAGIKQRVIKFFEAVKKFVKEMIAKIVFSINAATKSGNQLVSQYGDKVDNSKSYDTVEVKGYKYVEFMKWATDGSPVQNQLTEIETKAKNITSEVGGKYDSAVKAAKEDGPSSSEISKAQSEAEKAFNETIKKYKAKNSDAATWRKDLVKELTGQTVKNGTFPEIAKELLKAARGNQIEKIVVKVKDAGGMAKIKEELQSPKQKEEIKTMLNNFNRVIENTQEVIEGTIADIEKLAEGADDKTKGRHEIVSKVTADFVNVAVSALGTIYSAVNTVNRTVLSLEREADAMRKELFVKAYRSLHKKAAKDSVEEFDEMDEFIEEFEM